MRFLGGDAEVRTGKNDQKFTTFSLATKTSYKSKESGEYVSHTEWHRCIVFGKFASSQPRSRRAHTSRLRVRFVHRVHAEEGEEAGRHRWRAGDFNPQARPRREGGRRGRVR